MEQQQPTARRPATRVERARLINDIRSLRQADPQLARYVERQRQANFVD